MRARAVSVNIIDKRPDWAYGISARHSNHGYPSAYDATMWPLWEHLTTFNKEPMMLPNDSEDMTIEQKLWIVANAIDWSKTDFTGEEDFLIDGDM